LVEPAFSPVATTRGSISGVEGYDQRVKEK
jgi:hypothetical protein